MIETGPVNLRVHIFIDDKSKKSLLSFVDKVELYIKALVINILVAALLYVTDSGHYVVFFLQCVIFIDCLFEVAGNWPKYRHLSAAAHFLKMGDAEEEARNEQV